MLKVLTLPLPAGERERVRGPAVKKLNLRLDTKKSSPFKANASFSLRLLPETPHFQKFKRRCISYF